VMREERERVIRRDSRDTYEVTRSRPGDFGSFHPGVGASLTMAAPRQSHVFIFIFIFSEDTSNICVYYSKLKDARIELKSVICKTADGESMGKPP